MNLSTVTCSDHKSN